MKKNSNINGIVSIFIVVALIVGVWKGPAFFQTIMKQDMESSEVHQTLKK